MREVDVGNRSNITYFSIAQGRLLTWNTNMDIISYWYLNGSMMIGLVLSVAHKKHMLETPYCPQVRKVVKAVDAKLIVP